MADPSNAQDITHVIQLSVAPVFLLSAIGTILAVLTTRLGRVIDRVRVLTERMETAPDEKKKRILDEEQLLMRRRGIINKAFIGCTIAALLVCLLIAVAFVGYLLDVHLEVVMATLFILAMGSFVTGLILFLREVLLAAGSVHIEAR
jgi:hypothetical protein